MLIVRQPPDEWFIKLSDFGLTKRIVSDNSTTLKGTFSFLPPELLLEDNRRCDPFSGDIWSAGEVSCFLLTSKSVFADLSSRQRFASSVTQLQIPQFTTGTVSQQASRFLRAMMTAKPNARPSIGKALELPWMLPFEESVPLPDIKPTWPSNPKLRDHPAGSMAWTTAPVAPMETNNNIHRVGHDEITITHAARAFQNDDGGSHRIPSQEKSSPIEKPTGPGTSSELRPDITSHLPIDPLLLGCALPEDAFEYSKGTEAMKDSIFFPSHFSAKYYVAGSFDSVDAVQVRSYSLNHKVTLLRPTYMTPDMWTSLLQKIDADLPAYGMASKLPTLSILAREQKEHSGKDDLARRFIEIFRRHDYQSSIYCPVSIGRRQYACLLALLTLLDAKDSHPCPYNILGWDAWITPKPQDYLFWNLLDSCVDDECSDRKCISRHFARNISRQFERCLSCLQHFCLLHIATTEHECSGEGAALDIIHHEGLLNMITREDPEPDHIAFLGLDFDNALERMDLGYQTIAVAAGSVIEFRMSTDNTTWIIDPGSDRIVFELKSDSLSRSHAKIMRVNGKWHICDMGSVQGTFINGSRLSKSAEVSRWTLLRSGDLIQFGVNHPDGNDDPAMAVLLKVYFRDGRTWLYHKYQERSRSAKVLQDQLHSEAWADPEPAHSRVAREERSQRSSSDKPKNEIAMASKSQRGRRTAENKASTKRKPQSPWLSFLKGQPLLKGQRE